MFSFFLNRIEEEEENVRVREVNKQAVALAAGYRIWAFKHPEQNICTHFKLSATAASHASILSLGAAVRALRPL